MKETVDSLARRWVARHGARGLESPGVEASACYQAWRLEDDYALGALIVAMRREMGARGCGPVKITLEEND